MRDSGDRDLLTRALHALRSRITAPPPLAAPHSRRALPDGYDTPTFDRMVGIAVMEILVVERRDDPETAGAPGRRTTDAQYKQGILDEMRFFLNVIGRRAGGRRTREEDAVRVIFGRLWPEVYAALERGRTFDGETHYLNVARHIRMRRLQPHLLGRCACMGRHGGTAPKAQRGTTT